MLMLLSDKLAFRGYSLSGLNIHTAGRRSATCTYSCYIGCFNTQNYLVAVEVQSNGIEWQLCSPLAEKYFSANARS